MRTTNPTCHIQNSPAGRGFTLIESMVASVVLAFSVVAISAAVTASNRSNNAVDSTAAALSVARADMEVLAAQPLSAISSPSGGTTQTINLSAYDSAESLGDRAEVEATVQFISRSSLQGSRDIAVVKVQARTSDGHVATLYRVVTAEGNGQ